MAHGILDAAGVAAAVVVAHPLPLDRDAEQPGQHLRTAAAPTGQLSSCCAGPKLRTIGSGRAVHVF